MNALIFQAYTTFTLWKKESRLTLQILLLNNWYLIPRLQQQVNVAMIANKQARTLIFIATYNEKDNAEKLYQSIKRLNLDTDILFLDDNSPDQTGKILDQMAQRDPRLFVIHRAGKLGIGSAHKDGIKWAQLHKYEKLLTMDCDFTHSPEDIPRFIKAGETADIVVGSRYKSEKSLSEWNFFRKCLTKVGHFLTHTLLGMPEDASGAFRLYNLSLIPAEAFNIVKSNGYSFFFESLFILKFNKFSIAEIEINLPARTYGNSKMSLKEIFRSVKQLFSIYFDKLITPKKFMIPAKLETIDRSLMDDQNWDSYWGKKQSKSKFLYDIVAVFYRKFIICPNLTYYIRKYFKQGDSILHAGCGSGQVDSAIRDYVNITALDISTNALKIYGEENGYRAKLLHGSIFNIPASAEVFDGAYNLGVMEHFDEKDVDKIIEQLKHVLKNGKKMILFWPPEFGLSVIFLKFATFVCNKIFKMGVEFHPPEINRIRSKSDIEMLMAKHDLTLVEYSFNLKDLFTYVVVVAEKRS